MIACSMQIRKGKAWEMYIAQALNVCMVVEKEGHIVSRCVNEI